MVLTVVKTPQFDQATLLEAVQNEIIKVIHAFGNAKKRKHPSEDSKKPTSDIDSKSAAEETEQTDNDEAAHQKKVRKIFTADDTFMGTQIIQETSAGIRKSFQFTKSLYEDLDQVIVDLLSFLAFNKTKFAIRFTAFKSALLAVMQKYPTVNVVRCFDSAGHAIECNDSVVPVIPWDPFSSAVQITVQTKSSDDCKQTEFVTAVLELVEDFRSKLPPIAIGEFNQIESHYEMSVVKLYEALRCSEEMFLTDLEQLGVSHWRSASDRVTRTCRRHFYDILPKLKNNTKLNALFRDVQSLIIEQNIFSVSLESTDLALFAERIICLFLVCMQIYLHSKTMASDASAKIATQFNAKIGRRRGAKKETVSNIVKKKRQAKKSAKVADSMSEDSDHSTKLVDPVEMAPQDLEQDVVEQDIVEPVETAPQDVEQDVEQVETAPQDVEQVETAAQEIETGPILNRLQTENRKLLSEMQPKKRGRPRGTTNKPKRLESSKKKETVVSCDEEDDDIEFL